MDPGTSRVVCIGGATVDRKYRSREPVRLGTSNPATSERSFGGVARNVAENIARLGGRVDLVSILGTDENGRSVLSDLTHLHIGTEWVVLSDAYSTAEYVAVLEPDGNLSVGLADMAILDALTPALLHDAWPALSPSHVFADCNLPPETLSTLIDLARHGSALLAVDAVSTLKAARLPRDLAGIGILFLNLDEARALLSSPDIAPNDTAAALLERGAERVVLTLGEAGLLAADRARVVKIGAVRAQIVDATGAGDALIAATLMAMQGGRSFVDAARLGTIAAALTLESPASVRPDLSLALLEAEMSRRGHLAFEREPS